MEKKTWRFYVMPTPFDTITVRLTECKAPARTNLYKEMQTALARGTYLTSFGRKAIVGIGYELVEVTVA